MSYPALSQPGARTGIAGVRGTPNLVQPDPFGRHTLGRQLVIRVTALVALAALLITIATALATRQVLMSQLDRQLDAVTARVRDPGQHLPGTGTGPGQRTAAPWPADRHACCALRR